MSKIQAVIGPNGVPRVTMSLPLMWEVVGHLLASKLDINYLYQGTHFVIEFPGTKIDDVQKILDQWSAAPMKTPEVASAARA